MQIIKSSLFLIMLSSLFIYLFSNIKYIGLGSLLPEFLLLTFVASVILILVNYKNYNISFKTSFKLLILFFVYFIISILVYDAMRIKTFTIGTTGGIILFYLLGMLISINLKIFIEDSRSKVLYSGLFFSLVITFLLQDTAFELLKLLRADIFLISEFDTLYQRAGNFLIIVFLIYSYFISMLINLLFNKFKKLISAIFLLYVFNTFNILFLSQLFGSNHAFVVVLIIFLLTTLFFMIITFKSRITENKIVSLNAKFKYHILVKCIIMFILIVCFYQTFILFQEFFLKISDIGFNKIRILNFSGTNSVSSVSSRLDLLSLFNLHFMHNPFFGNFIVDKITTGEGTYVHSFLGSLLTHQGIFGFGLFFSFMYFSFKEYFIELKENVDYLFLIYFCSIFVLAIMFLFFTNISIWFLIGFIFSPIVFKNRKEKQIE